jgi:hypothetical protein
MANRVRIGPLSLFALAIMIALAVLAMLVFSTANGTYSLAHRQANAVSAYYFDDRTAQEFIADMDGVLARVRTQNPRATADDAARAVQDELDGLCQAARRSGGGQVMVAAAIENNTVKAQFTRMQGGALSVEATLLDGAVYRIDAWDMSAVQNQEEPEGPLFTLEDEPVYSG